MQDKSEFDGFQGIDAIVAEPLKFKVKLAIGEDAYTSLRVKKAVVQVWDVAGVATTAAVVAKSSVVASTFFAPTGLLAAIGIGAAVTPIGWGERRRLVWYYPASEESLGEQGHCSAEFHQYPARRAGTWPVRSDGAAGA